MADKQQTTCPRVDIGGQAVMEGVMMKGPDAIAITVRRPDGSMAVRYEPYVALSKKHKWMGWPVIRGAVNMANMLVMGMQTLETSTKMLGIMDEEPTKFEKWLAEKLGKGIDKVVMGMAMILAVILSVGLFILVPTAVEKGIIAWTGSTTAATLVGGVVKILLLIGYMIFCGMVPDVRRTFQYHGAEHKTVYCHEHDLPLTPENAKGFTTLHPRCGTAFLLIVFVISILMTLLIGRGITVFIWRFLFHLAMLPVIAGVSYEVLKGLAHSDSKLARALRWPGLQMQRLTTREPDEKMLECAIVSMNVALYGLPKNAPKNRDGFTILHSYKESEKGYVFEKPEVKPVAEAAEAVAEEADEEAPVQEPQA
ncbi:MAG: DUF1385 domain-containing protein [Clostridia bacterium]|nr:DUF1385 domain-containing protein [Clostridia bacterium]